MLQVLTRNALARTEHLDLLWAVTEAEGTFDVVKANVYSMIQDLAAHLQPVGEQRMLQKCESQALTCWGTGLLDSLTPNLSRASGNCIW